MHPFPLPILNPRCNRNPKSNRHHQNLIDPQVRKCTIGVPVLELYLDSPLYQLVNRRISLTMFMKLHYLRLFLGGAPFSSSYFNITHTNPFINLYFISRFRFWSKGVKKKKKNIEKKLADFEKNLIALDFSKSRYEF